MPRKDRSPPGRPIRGALTEGCIVWLMERAMSGKLGVNYWWVAPVSAQAAIAFSRMRDTPEAYW